MKYLILIRHAKSSWKNVSLDDFDRPLNKRGKNDAPLMGKVLRKKGISPDLVYSSPAKRASVTARIICDKINFPEEKIVFNNDLYESTGDKILDEIKQTNNNVNMLMVFGHNPGLTSLHNYLCEKFIDNIPTCGIVQLQFDGSWDNLNSKSAEQVFFEYPKMYYKSKE